MKKILAAALAVITAAFALTGCNDNKEPASNPSNSTGNTSNDNTSSDNSAAGTGIADHLESVTEAYLNNVKNNPDIAFYPMQQASAEGAVRGKTKDGYLYVIVHENGEEIAKVLDDPSVKLPDPDPEVDNSGIEYPDNKAGELAKRVLNTEWAFMNAVSDQETINMLFSEDFKLDLCEEYFFASSMMSTQLLKVIIIKPKAGDMA